MEEIAVNPKPSMLKDREGPFKFLVTCSAAEVSVFILIISIVKEAGWSTEKRSA